MDPAPDRETSDTRDIVRRLLQVALSIVVTGVLLSALAGTLHWPFAWLYLGASVAVILVNTLIFPRELIAEGLDLPGRHVSGIRVGARVGLAGRGGRLAGRGIEAGLRAGGGRKRQTRRAETTTGRRVAMPACC